MAEHAFVVLLRVHLHFPDSGSLKAKRAELNPVKALLRDRCGASVAEVGHQDRWQRSTLAVAVRRRLGGRAATEAADAIVRSLDARCPRACASSGASRRGADLEAIG